MSHVTGRQAAAQYQQVGVAGQVADASPHRLIALMLDGALARIAGARGAMDNGDVSAKGLLIGRAIGLVEGLRTSLDQERGGELAANLDSLYEYMGRRLLEANLHNDAAALDEVTGLLREIQSAWTALGESVP